MALLPREIWMLVYVLCPDIQTAVRLSAANKELREIWLDKHAYIATAILKPDIPAYDDAIRVARLETRTHLSQLLTDSATSGEYVESPQCQYSAHLWLPRLLRNAHLALVVSFEWDEYKRKKTNHPYVRCVDLRSPTIPSGPKAYYLMRELVASWEMPELRPSLTSRLKSCPADALETYFWFCGFMLMSMSNAMDDIHGVERTTPFEKWSFPDENQDSHVQLQWAHAEDMIHEPWRTRRIAAEQENSTASLGN